MQVVAKHKSPQIALLLAFASALMVLSSCNSGELTRSRAERLIAESPAFKEEPTIELILGYISITPSYRTLEKDGLIQLAPTECQLTYRRSVCGNASLTEKGVAASRGWIEKPASGGVRRFLIPIGSRMVRKITGITESPWGGTVAHFHWDCQLNEVGRHLEGDILDNNNCPPSTHVKKTVALFNRYDDGWRLELLGW